MHHYFCRKAVTIPPVFDEVIKVALCVSGQLSCAHVNSRGKAIELGIDYQQRGVTFL